MNNASTHEQTQATRSQGEQLTSLIQNPGATSPTVMWQPKNKRGMKFIVCCCVFLNIRKYPHPIFFPIHFAETQATME